ncbi:MAG: hypothetical protein WC516_06850 [Patescibacteria group bacterium]|jgi:hypothetical protein
MIELNNNEIRVVLNSMAMLKGKVSAVTDKKKFDSLHKRLSKALYPIKPRSCKAKGRSFQQWVCKEIGELLGIEYKQLDDQCEIHSREMGLSGNDVVLRGEALKKFPFSVEVKNVEKFNLLQTIRQVVANQSQGTNWIIFHKKNGSVPIVVLEWEVLKNVMAVSFRNKNYTGV